VENHHQNISVSKDIVIHTTRWILDKLNFNSNAYIAFILVDDKKITELNRIYLKKNIATDVLAFDLTDNEDVNLEGEIYISLDRIVEQASEYRVTFNQELIRLVAHGVLHLLGYKDDSEEEKSIMSSFEDDAIKAMARYNRWRS